MILRKRLKDPKLMIRIGAACLLLANLSRWFLHPTADFWQGLIDGMTGTLFGISFACLLLSLRRADRQCSRGEA